MVAFTDALKTQITDNLAGFEVHHHDLETDLKHAAVALTVVQEDPHGTDHEPPAALLLTRRSSRLSAHPGQWAIPGGRVDPGESPLEAARRELWEELDLTLPEDALLGRLDDYQTRSGYVISPFVFWGAETRGVTPNPAEVASVHRIPLAAYIRDDLIEYLEGPDPDRPILRINLLDNDIHAPTAAMLYQFWDVGIRGLQTRVAHYDQPEWAWR